MVKAAVVVLMIADIVISVGGRCMNRRGVPLQFRAVLKSSGDRNFVVAAFVDTTASPTYRQRVLDVTESFAISQAA